MYEAAISRARSIGNGLSLLPLCVELPRVEVISLISYLVTYTLVSLNAFSQRVALPSACICNHLLFISPRLCLS